MLSPAHSNLNLHPSTAAELTELPKRPHGLAAPLSFLHSVRRRVLGSGASQQSRPSAGLVAAGFLASQEMNHWATMTEIRSLGLGYHCEALADTSVLYKLL